MFDEYEEQQEQEAFDEGHGDGQEADFLDELIHDIGETVTCIVPETDEHKAYEAGYRKGLRER